MLKQIFKTILISLLFFVWSASPALAQEDQTVCSVYITGVGCPNCSVTDPILLTELTAEYPDLIVIEYEIYNLRASNQNVAGQYFETYIPVGRPGVPFLIFNKQQTALGRFEVVDSGKIIQEKPKNPCPLPDGSLIDFNDLDIVRLPGKVKIWTKDRVLLAGSGSDNRILRKILAEKDISDALKGVDFKEVEPIPVVLSGGEVYFSHAIEILDSSVSGNWILQWNGGAQAMPLDVDEILKTPWQHWHGWVIVLFILGILYAIYKIWVAKCVAICLSDRQKDFIIVGIATVMLIGLFILAKNISPDILEKAGYTLPLPLFTLFIGLIDGFNPCNLFVLTFLLALLTSASHSKSRIYAVGFSFIFVVFVVYFLFMAAWLNIFKYIGFIAPLRIAIAMIALIAGAINCKELLFWRKGITLMVQDRHKGLLVRKIEHMKDVIKKGSMPILISSSIALAAFASLVELPCTAGFPIIYTGILSAKLLASTLGYYLYLLLYNLVYILPLAVVITIFGYTLQGKQISQRQMQIIKFIGGLIMIILGLILLVNPSMIGIYG